MECGKFIISGEDKKTLASIKNALVGNGHIFLGYLKESQQILRHIRNNAPDLVVIEVVNHFKSIKPTLEVIDEELLTACILVVDIKTDEITDFLMKSRVISYVTKPVFDEVVMQISDVSLMNFKRVLEYEQKVRKLNETLESRKVVEKAKWILVEKEGYTESEAYDAIRKKSRDNRMPMRNIAEALILTRG